APLASRPGAAPQGAADLARAPLDRERRRLPRAHPAAGQDHDRGAAADPPARAVRRRPRPGRDLRVRDAADAGDPRRARRRAALPGDRMRLRESVDISAEPGLVWEHVADPARYLHFMHGITRWQVAGPVESGLGARYRMLMRVGSAEVGGLIEVVEFSPPYDLAWTSVLGVDQRGRWRLRELEDGRRRAELVAAPTIGSNLRRSLHQLKRQVEHERLRAEAARRRREREASSA